MNINRKINIISNKNLKSRKTSAKLKEKLLDLIDKEEDSIRFYYLGNNWERRVEHIGAKKTYNPEGVIIIWFLNETGELLVIKKI